MISRQLIVECLDIVPENAKACYTGQSILGYCPDATFTFEEMNHWNDETDLDIFAYTQTSHAVIVQQFINAGFKPANPIEEFKADRIRFWERSSKFSLQTVKLQKEGFPVVNISWTKGVEDALDCIKRFDMDYLMVSMDLKTRVFADLRGKNHRIAHVNPYHTRFDPFDTEPSFWYRQFERCPKGWNRGIDTRPVAKQYLQWIETCIKAGDKAIHSKTREYQNKAMQEAVAPVIATGITEEQAQALWKMLNHGNSHWEAALIKHQAMQERIKAWLQEVEDN